ncbi:hypothetical protein C0Q70_17074 [Pomacea canaliculata]|uniref:NADAR domain-containing protein n=1 Tax=Pomacea canaliculata TaxID=400727 RepID=A0A2T7NRJ6_POMCA|nr:hypothetical protein C0Q70_17074 [Pomacea canaliculata]
MFRDREMAQKIMGTKNPAEQKRFGRKVRNFDKEVWAVKAPGVVKRANNAKFSQNKHLLQQLLSTCPNTLAEASPRDRLWGIRLEASNPKAKDRRQWRGKNLLGHILTEVREELMKEEEEDNEKT